MGAMSVSPGSNGDEEAEAVPEGATPSDPLMSAMGELSDNPMSNIIPIDWMEISKALQTLHERQMSDPQRTTRVATDYNRRLFQTTMKVWSDAASRLSGLPRQEEEEEGKPDKRLAVPSKQVSGLAFGGDTLKDLYITTASTPLSNAELAPPGLMSATSWVPASLPSLAQNSVPWVRSAAAK